MFLQKVFFDIWKKITQWREHVSYPAECKDCVFIPDCRGGCRLASKLCFDNYTAKDPWARDPVNNYRRKTVLSDFDPHCSYKLLSDLRWRKENGGFLMYFDTGHLLVNSDGLDFVRQLPQEFVPYEILDTTKENREIQFQFLKGLYHNGLIIKDRC